MNHRLWIGVLAGILGGNALGAIAYLKVIKPERSSVQAGESIPVRKPDPASQARRMAGLDAIERGDFEAAIQEFSAGLRAAHPVADLPQLLAIAQSMKARDAMRATARASKPVAPMVGEGPRPPPPPRPALVMVTTQPPGLVIEIDGEVRDLSPARIEVKPGRHRVVIRRGADRVYRRPVRVKDAAVALVDVDLTDRVAALAPTAPTTGVPGSSVSSASSPAVAEPSASTQAASLAALVMPPPFARPSPPRAEGAGDAGPSPGIDASTATPQRSAAVAPLSARPRVASAVAAATPAEAGADAGRAGSALGRTKSVPARTRRAPAISRQEIRRVAAASHGAFKACYDRLPAFLVTGRVVFALDVRADGSVQQGRIRSSTVQSKQLRNCISRVARGLRFSRPKGGPTKIAMALRFDTR